MILDSSAVIAVLQGEPEAMDFVRALHGAAEARISAANWFESAILVDQRGDAAARAGFEDFFNRFGITVEPVTLDHARRARAAYRQFGRGRHPARLNFGDCFAYALAQERGEPLLFKGSDFARTDITPALPARP